MARSVARLPRIDHAITGGFVALVLMLTAGDAHGCSCAPISGIESAFKNASLVVVAEAVSVAQRRLNDDDPTYLEEHATLRIVETLKGTKLPGDLVYVRSLVGGPGPCGRSVWNSPVWLEAIGEGGEISPAVISGRWLVYAPAGQGEEQSPLELSMCGRHNPAEVAEDELVQLRALRDTVSNNEGGT